MESHSQVVVGDVSALADGQMMSCVAGATNVLICRVKGSLYAIEDRCSHADVVLSTGLLQGHIVTCPRHGARFDVRDGSHAGPPAHTGVKSFDISHTDTGIAVTLRKRSGQTIFPKAGTCARAETRFNIM